MKSEVDFLRERVKVLEEELKEKNKLLTKTDVSEKAQKQISQYQLQLEQALSAANAGTFFFNILTNHVEWDEHSIKMFGFTKESFQYNYDAWKNRLIPEDYKNCEPEILQTMQKNGPNTLDITYRIKYEDTIKYIRAQGFIQRDKEGRALLMNGLHFDITEQVLAEQKILETNKRLELSLQGGNLGVWDWDLMSGKITVDERWAEILGYKVSEVNLNTDTMGEFLHPDDLPRVMQKVERHFSGKDEFYSIELRMKRKDAHYCWISSGGKVVKRDENGKPLRMVGVHTDINESKNKNEQIKHQNFALEESNRRLNLAAKASFDLMYEWDVKNDNLKWFNDIDTTLGFEFGEISNNIEAWLALIHYSDVGMLANAVEEHRISTTPISYEYRIRHKDGSYRYWKDYALPMLDEEGKANKWIGVCTDITKSKESEEKLNIAKEKAEDASLSKSNFLANMSHEIRTPMTGMLGFIERLVRDEKDNDRLEQLKTVQKSGHTLLAIINDILDFSKIESGKIEIESSPLDLNELFKNSMDVFLSISSGKDINLHLLINETLPSCIMGDETRLKQIIFNLVSNAIKFTNKGGDVSIQANYNTQKKTINIAVIDSGVGIAKENLLKIFEAFSQADISTTRRFGGTGLGLSISSRLVRLMGSELKVQSEVGKGSKFYFELPVEISQNICESERKTVEPLDNLSEIEGHVLIVEDNKTNQMLLKMILDDYNITYDVANDGAEGVLNFKLNKYDVVLMDENMPIMNGLESTQHIREMEEDNLLTPTPIIAVTANALTGDKEKFLAAGMNDYVAKPYSEEDIISVLQKYLVQK